MEKAESHEGAPKNINTPGTPSPVDDVPDPEEDDLDDLDGMIGTVLNYSLLVLNVIPDMLDEFSATKIHKPEDASKKPEPAREEELQEPDIPDEAANEFSRQLQEQMAALMGNVDESPEMKKEIEAMMRELGAAADPGASAEQTQSKDDLCGKAAASAAEEPFQETIRKTMERMQASGEQATAAAQSKDSDDMLAQMLKEMQNGGLEGAGDDEGFNKMLMGMMEQLTNKEILYEPMKELHYKFPEWMTKNKSTANAEDLKRYEEQQRLVGEIVGRFEMKGYSDDRAEDREFIVERMQQV